MLYTVKKAWFKDAAIVLVDGPAKWVSNGHVAVRLSNAPNPGPIMNYWRGTDDERAEILMGRAPTRTIDGGNVSGITGPAGSGAAKWERTAVLVETESRFLRVYRSGTRVAYVDDVYALPAALYGRDAEHRLVDDPEGPSFVVMPVLGNGAVDGETLRAMAETEKRHAANQAV